MVKDAIPWSSDQVGPAISRGSPSGSMFASWHRVIASSKSSNARAPAISSSGMVALVRLGAEHRLVVIGMGDGPAHVRPCHVDHSLVWIGRFGGNGAQRLVKLDETLGGDGGQQLRLVGEVTVWRSGAHASTSGDLSEGEAFRPLLVDQPQRRLRECPLQITVVIGVTLLR